MRRKTKSLLALPASVSAPTNESLTCFDQFGRMRDAHFAFVALKHTIQEPNNETVREQNERAYDSWMRPQM